MISSQAHQFIEGFDEIVIESDADFGESGLKVTSVIRVGRLAVVWVIFFSAHLVKFQMRELVG